MSCGMPRVSGWPGLGGGLLRGMMVVCMGFAEEPPGLTFMLLTLSASGARSSWADEQSKIQMPTLPGCVYSNISAEIWFGLEVASDPTRHHGSFQGR